jgi:hypothetical protein
MVRIEVNGLDKISLIGTSVLFVKKFKHWIQIWIFKKYLYYKKCWTMKQQIPMVNPNYLSKCPLMQNQNFHSNKNV